MSKRAYRPKPNGYVLHADNVRVVIATGFRRQTKNRKTGPMLQIWILRKDQDPVTANRSGADRVICGNCPLRGRKGEGRACYVVLAHDPLSVFKAFKRGSYPPLPSYSLFKGASVRFGAYGDPVHIPLPIVTQIIAQAASHTGYTHQWANPSLAGYQLFFMASADSPEQAKQAQALNWRTYRAQVNGTTPLMPLPSEIICPHYSRGTQCVDCGLCSGSGTAKSILSPAHGNGAKFYPTPPIHG